MENFFKTLTPYKLTKMMAAGPAVGVGVYSALGYTLGGTAGAAVTSLVAPLAPAALALAAAPYVVGPISNKLEELSSGYANAMERIRETMRRTHHMAPQLTGEPVMQANNNAVRTNALRQNEPAFDRSPYLESPISKPVDPELSIDGRQSAELAR